MPRPSSRMPSTSFKDMFCMILQVPSLPRRFTSPRTWQRVGLPVRCALLPRIYAKPQANRSIIVAAYWEYTPTQLLNSFVDRHLIEMMPELLVSSHVRIDGAIVLIYYSVLYDGCNFRAMTTNPEDIQHAKSIYLCCLRALPGWEREITGTMVDIVAAMSLVWSLPVRFPCPAG